MDLPDQKIFPWFDEKFDRPRPKEKKTKVSKIEDFDNIAMGKINFGVSRQSHNQGAIRILISGWFVTSHEFTQKDIECIITSWKFSYSHDFLIFQSHTPR